MSLEKDLESPWASAKTGPDWYPESKCMTDNMNRGRSEARPGLLIHGNGEI